VVRPLLILHLEVELCSAEATTEQTTGGCRQPVDPAEAFAVGSYREPRVLHIVAEVEHGPDEAQALLLCGRLAALLGLQGTAVESHGFQLAVWLLLEQGETELGVARTDVDGEGRAAARERQELRMKQSVA